MPLSFLSPQGGHISELLSLLSQSPRLSTILTRMFDILKTFMDFLFQIRKNAKMKQIINTRFKRLEFSDLMVPVLVCRFTATSVSFSFSDTN